MASDREKEIAKATLNTLLGADLFEIDELVQQSVNRSLNLRGFAEPVAKAVNVIALPILTVTEMSICRQIGVSVEEFSRASDWRRENLDAFERLAPKKL